MAATEVQMDSRIAHRHGPSQTYAHLPASPTLTNPDMILPDYDRPVSPGMDLDDGHDHSSLTMWKNAVNARNANDMAQIFGNALGQQHPNGPYGPTGPVTPTTPIIYGNGTMLSDIGEVTEVESTVGNPSPARARALARRQHSPTRDSSSDAALRSSPTMGIESSSTRRSSKNMLPNLERRSSTESTSTITTQERSDLFADFDDSVSVEDSVFQGDDEESVAESYAEQALPRESNARLGVPQSDNIDRLSITSSSSLSRRAEEILANAKRKLTVSALYHPVRTSCARSILIRMMHRQWKATSHAHVAPSMFPLHPSLLSTPTRPHLRPSKEPRRPLTHGILLRHLTPPTIRTLRATTHLVSPLHRG